MTTVDDPETGIERVAWFTVTSAGGGVRSWAYHGHTSKTHLRWAGDARTLCGVALPSFVLWPRASNRKGWIEDPDKAEPCGRCHRRAES